FLPDAGPLHAVDLAAKRLQSVSLLLERVENALLNSAAAVQVDVHAAASLADPVDAILGLEALTVLEPISIEHHVAGDRHVQPVAADALRGHQEPSLPAPALQVLLALFRWYVAV